MTPTSSDPAELSSYAGEWVVLSGNRVVGVGPNAAEAATLAGETRPGEHIHLRYVEREEGSRLVLSPFLDQLRPLFEKHPRPVYLVGGAVRDALLGRISHDLDFVSPRKAISLAFKVGNSLDLPAYAMDRDRDIGRVVVTKESTMLDFAAFRGPDLETDLTFRDFTINAMAIPATARFQEALVDPCQGLADLRRGILRLTHRNSIAEDPVRALRAVRLALALDFEFAEQTLEAISEARTSLSETTVERRRDEFIRLLSGKQPRLAIDQLRELGLMGALWPGWAIRDRTSLASGSHRARSRSSVLYWLAQIERIVDAWPDVVEGREEQGISALLGPRAEGLIKHWDRPVDGGLQGRLLGRLSALFCDLDVDWVWLDDRGAPWEPDNICGQRVAISLQGYHFSRSAVSQVRAMVALRQLPLTLLSVESLSRKVSYRYFQQTGTLGVDVAILAMAQHLSHYEGVGPDDKWNTLSQIVSRLLDDYFMRFGEVIQPQLLIDGNEVMRALGLGSGPEIGTLLLQVEEAQAAGEVSTREEALALVQAIINKKDAL